MTHTHTCRALNDIIMQGPLQKLSSGVTRRWQSRYFILHGKYLKYYRDANHCELGGVIDLSRPRLTVRFDSKTRTIVIEQKQLLERANGDGHSSTSTSSPCQLEQLQPLQLWLRVGVRSGVGLGFGMLLSGRTELEHLQEAESEAAATGRQWTHHISVAMSSWQP